MISNRTRVYQFLCRFFGREEREEGIWGGFLGVVLDCGLASVMEGKGRGGNGRYFVGFKHGYFAETLQDAQDFAAFGEGADGGVEGDVDCTGGEGCHLDVTVGSFGGRAVVRGC